MSSWQLWLVLLLAASAGALRCWRCGQYSDGVGSITPCTNHSAARLSSCQPEAKYCIKYVSELTVVRDCVPTCTEKDLKVAPMRHSEQMYHVALHGGGAAARAQARGEWWGARTYCCQADECNAAGPGAAPLLPLLLLAAAPLLR